jgi:hypothetical protein
VGELSDAQWRALYDLNQTTLTEHGGNGPYSPIYRKCGDITAIRHDDILGLIRESLAHSRYDPDPAVRAPRYTGYRIHITALGRAALAARQDAPRDA